MFTFLLCRHDQAKSRSCSHQTLSEQLLEIVTSTSPPTKADTEEENNTHKKCAALRQTNMDPQSKKGAFAGSVFHGGRIPHPRCSARPGLGDVCHRVFVCDWF